MGKKEQIARNRALYKDIYTLTDNEKATIYRSTTEDNILLKEKADFLKSLKEQQNTLREEAILKSREPINSVSDLINKYSNENHVVTYDSLFNIIKVKGSMRVDVFHLFRIEADKFNFNNIILED